LAAHARSGLKIGAFSAASNVTGVVTDVDAVTRTLKRHGALAIWDYAGGAPYLAIDMAPGAGIEKDAVVASPHKFPGGPGASGILIVRRGVVRAQRPTWPGGSTVSFVSPWDHDYVADIAAREEGGTPNVIGDIRAALAFLVKEAVGQDWITAREAALNAMALAVWQRHPRLQLLGCRHPHRLPIFSFRVRDGAGGFIHHQLFTRMLSDVHGVQARGGCACAGPYAHRLLDIDAAASRALRAAIAAGHELEKPGWVRLNFSYLMDDATAQTVIDAVDRLAWQAPQLAARYRADSRTARFRIAEDAAAKAR
ncbi:MAG: aminotransferase class V-fold PLP-dependent enzyme, partial [Alphaproteobacteria bacterium]